MTRSFLTNEQKLLLRAHWAAQPQLSSAEAANWVRAQFHVSVSRSTLYRIAQAPEHAFAGSLRRKKRRRVKFPAFEHELLAFCLAAQCSSASECADNSSSSTEPQALPSIRAADALARKAVELRAKHGIAPDELKLSNGWMHKFKERHCLATKAPIASNALQTQASSHTRDDDASNDSAPVNEQTSQSTPPPEPAPAVDSADSTPVCTRNSNAPRPLESSLSPPGAAVSPVAVAVAVATPVPPSPTRPSNVLDTRVLKQPPRVRPLVHITAKALSAVRSPGTLNWEPCAHQQPLALAPSASHFAIVDSGIHVQRAGVYQINVDVEHTSGYGTASAPSDSAEVFSIWQGTEQLELCSSNLRRDASGVALSVAEVQCALPASACVRVVFSGRGFALPSSRIVIRWVHHDDNDSVNDDCSNQTSSSRVPQS